MCQGLAQTPRYCWWSGFSSQYQQPIQQIILQQSPNHEGVSPQGRTRHWADSAISPAKMFQGYYPNTKALGGRYHPHLFLLAHQSILSLWNVATNQTGPVSAAFIPIHEAWGNHKPALENSSHNDNRLLHSFGRVEGMASLALILDRCMEGSLPALNACQIDKTSTAHISVPTPQK